MDAKQGEKADISGMYKLIPVGAAGGIAKMDEITVEIRLVSACCVSPGADCNEMTR
jgi:hypothetical protein